MTGITFLNASFWPWLFALVFPVWLHLRTRRARRVVTLPTFQFLQRASAHQSRRFRLRNLLLLAARMALVLALILTFLKPVTLAPLAVAPGERRAVIVVLDTSLSMGLARGGISSLARARGQALAFLEDLRAGDAANVILAGAVPQMALPRPGGDFGLARQTLKDAQALPERADLQTALALAAEQFANSRAARKECLLAGDFQRASWGGVRLDVLPPDVRVIFVNSADASPDNTAITGLRLNPATPRAGEEAGLTADVWNGGAQARLLPVTLTLAQADGAWGGPPETRTLVVPPHATAALNFPLAFARPGRYRCVARLPDDDLNADNTRCLVADLQRGLNVLLLTDADTIRPGSGAYFLRRALNPAPALPGGARVVVKSPVGLSETDLKTSDVVVFSEVNTLPADRLPMLTRYVAEGGALIVFFGGPKIVAQMSALAQAIRTGDRLPFLPQSLMDAGRQGRGYITLAEARYDSPLLALFRDPGVADLSKLQFRRFYITGEPDPRAEILLKFEDGAPALARGSLGAGSVLLCNFSPAGADSDLSRQPVFPPLVQELVKGVTASQASRREFSPGGLASATLEPGQARGTVEAFGPDGQPERLTVDPTGGGAIIERVTQCGFHTIRAGGRLAALLAVNPPAEESDLRPLDPHSLEKRRSGRGAYIVRAGGAGSGDTVEPLRRGRPLWPYSALAALALLLVEQWLATLGAESRVARVKSP